MKKLNQLLALSLVIFPVAFALAGDGHDHGPAPKLDNAETLKVGEIEYLNLGEKIDVGGVQLERQVIADFGIIYLGKKADGVSGKIGVAVPGTKTFPGLKTDELDLSTADSMQVKAPSFDQETSVDRAGGLEIAWAVLNGKKASDSRVQIIIESLQGTKISGRITVDTQDFGSFKIEPQALSELAPGPARIAVKRIRALGMPLKDKSEIVTIYTVSSQTGSLILK